MFQQYPRILVTVKSKLVVQSVLLSKLGSAAVVGGTGRTLTRRGVRGQTLIPFCDTNHEKNFRWIACLKILDFS
jgi:hypothetical protein